MKKIFSEQFQVAIDIGTTKICVLIAYQDAAGSIELIGIGKAPSFGLKKGIVVDIAKTVQSIKAAVKEAELMAGVTIERAIIGISGSHIQSRSSLGMSTIKHGVIRGTDIAQAIASARSIVVPEGQQILHALPQYFIIDGSQKIFDPHNMSGVRLEAMVHIITGSVSCVQNLITCCQMAGVNVQDIVLEQLASAHAVLSVDERNLGIAMLDIGGGTSDLALYQNNTIVHTKVIAVAGNHMTHDLAIGLHTTMAQAEELKKKYAFAHHSLLQEDSCLEISSADGVGKHVIMQSEIVYIIQARVQELLQLVKEEIDRHSMNTVMATGLVLTGGGSLVQGLDVLARILFQVPVRVGVPVLETPFMHIQSPTYATAYGLLLHALKKQDTSTIQGLSGPLVTRIFARMKSWMSDFL